MKLSQQWLLEPPHHTTPLHTMSTVTFMKACDSLHHRGGRCPNVDERGKALREGVVRSCEGRGGRGGGDDVTWVLQGTLRFMTTAFQHPGQCSQQDFLVMVKEI